MILLLLPALATPWHDTLERLDPKQPSPWKRLVEAPGLDEASWIGAERLWSCSSSRCTSWDHQGGTPQDHPLLCSASEIMPSPGGRWVAYRCAEEWVRWDTQTGQTSREQRVGDAAIDDQGLLTQVFEAQGIWAVRRTLVARMLELKLPEGLSRDAWPLPANGAAQVYTSNLGGRDEAIWFQDGPKVPIDGGVLVIGERTIVSHLSGGYSEVTAGGMRRLKGSPKAGWGGRGGLSGHGPWGETGVLWWFESGVVLLDEELQVVGARTLPEYAELWSSPDGTTLFAHQRAGGHWHRLELGDVAKRSRGPQAPTPPTP